MLHYRISALSIVCVVLLVLSVPSGQCLAETRAWTGVLDDNWYNGNNWLPGGGPYESDILTVLSGSPQTTWDVTTDDGGSITIDGPSTSASFGGLYIAPTGTASMYIHNGAYVSNTSATIGSGSGAAGSFTVTGAGSTWSNTSSLKIGSYYEGEGTGALFISDGGSVSSNYSFIYANGTATVTGADSTWSATGGFSSEGVLEISNGGIVVSDSELMNQHFCGLVTVTGAGSSWTNANISQLTIGNYMGGGTGNLEISDGGTVSSTSVSISDGTVTVTGAGSTWINSGALGVYSSSSAYALEITDGGSVSNNNCCINSSAGPPISVSVTGTDSIWNSVSLYVGGNEFSPFWSAVNVTVRNGGEVHVGKTLKVWSPGTLDIGATGHVTVAHELFLEQDATLTTEAGATIHMTGSALRNKSTNSANLAGLGNLKLIFEGGSIITNPIEPAGEDMGPVIGGFCEANFLLDTLQLGGTAAGRIKLSDDFDNQSDGATGNEAVYVNNLIMNAGATIDLNGLNLYYDSADPKQFFCGDADLNGFVGQDDLDTVLGDWGENVPPANHRADLSGDFFVGQDDLDTVLGDWGEGAGSIPEPASLSLLVIGAFMCLRRRRK